jgi:soluble lytic murein transglycosylase-like protein
MMKLLLPLIGCLFFQPTAQGSTRPIMDYIQLTEKKFSLPDNLLYAIIDQESSFQIKAKSQDSHGLGQIRLGTAREFCDIHHKSQLYDYRKNIECAATFLKYQLDRYENVYLAIAAFNAGTPFVCNGRVYKRDLGRRVETLKNPCNKKGVVANSKYVKGVMQKWKSKNKDNDKYS